MKSIIAAALLTTILTSPFQAKAYEWIEAANYYAIDPYLLVAISSVESNFDNNAVNENDNGTLDVCHMQINEQWKNKIDIDYDLLRQDANYCTMIGAYVLAECQRMYGNTWDAVSCYNTGASPAMHSIRNEPEKEKRAIQYAEKVRKIYMEYRGKDLPKTASAITEKKKNEEDKKKLDLTGQQNGIHYESFLARTVFIE